MADIKFYKITEKTKLQSDNLKTVRQKTEKIFGALMQLIALNENNKFLSYSKEIVRQIPHSHAANAYNVVQEGLHHYEIIRLCALWDYSQQDRICLPAVIELLKDEKLQKEILDWHVSFNSSYINQKAQKRAILKVKRDLAYILKVSAKIFNCNELESLRNSRHKFMAHNLEITTKEKKGNVYAPKYGYEIDLLKKTMKVVEKLYYVVLGSHIDIEDFRKDKRDAANHLWKNCRFNIKK